MRRILLAVLITAGSLLAGTTPAGACHPPPPNPLPDLGCPHCVRVDNRCVIPLP